MAEPSRGYLNLWAVMLVLWLLMPVAFYVKHGFEWLDLVVPTL